jgi:hypothetical protein
MSEKVVYETAKQAAKFWTKSLRSRARFWKSQQGSLANSRRVIVLSENQKKTFDQESIQAYEQALAVLISEQIEETGTCKIITCFGAEGILVKAAKSIGFEVSMLSVECKTTMTVTKESVTIDRPYGRTQL